ncbi:unnamed protein product [Heligmosomoides polygyrus]|uniref:J domain-containing protein n=1 Tax=Heligmosomoides polygyrus TaxID=6339 RepID=A0A183G9J8_HELPZ|nr:unnamed protein product [Heligmosomoides polygyrus]
MSFSGLEPEFYRALGCDRSSSIEQITAEYRSRVKHLHPDKLLDEGSQQKHDEPLFQSAYSTLSDEQERRCYDAWLDCPLPMNYEEFRRNRDAIKVSMHWVTPKQTPMLSASDAEDPRKSTQGEPMISSRWNSGRYHSETVRKFRNYEL